MANRRRIDRFKISRGLVAFALVFAACEGDDPKLKVTNISPNKGDSKGDTRVVISGNRFQKDGPRNAKVYFGSRQGSVVGTNGDSELVVITPGGKPGEVVDVIVMFDPGGQLRIPKAFTYVEAKEGAKVEDLAGDKAPETAPAPAAPPAPAKTP